MAAASFEHSVYIWLPNLKKYIVEWEKVKRATKMIKEFPSSKGWGVQDFSV